jgi:hypothetical protein
MPPFTLDCLEEELTAFLPGPGGAPPHSTGAADFAPDQLLGKVLQFESIDPNCAESLISGRRR